MDRRAVTAASVSRQIVPYLLDSTLGSFGAASWPRPVTATESRAAPRFSNWRAAIGRTGYAQLLMRDLPKRARPGITYRLHVYP